MNLLNASKDKKPRFVFKTCEIYISATVKYYLTIELFRQRTVAATSAAGNNKFLEFHIKCLG